MDDPVKRLLIVEKDTGLQSQLSRWFEGLEVHIASDRESAMEWMRRFEPHVVTLDLSRTPDPEGPTEGFATLQEILGFAPYTKIIVMADGGDREIAVQAIGMGAYDYYQKPVDGATLKFVVDRAFRLDRLEEENRRLTMTSARFPLEGVVAVSDSMVDTCRAIEAVAPTDIAVLLVGEIGTGKGLLARAIHDLSGRAHARFIAVSCSTTAERLLDRELFGDERFGSAMSTGASKGRIADADGGTLFLDEVGDLPLALQSELLRLLETGLVESRGGGEDVAVNVRIVCATHRDLELLVRDGTFREDLFYRISEMAICVPPLRRRPGDPVALAQTLLGKHASQYGRTFRRLSDDAVAAIESYSWPGNVRELENRVRRAVVLAGSGIVNAGDLDLEPANDPFPVLNLRQIRSGAERQAVIRAITYARGNVSKAARLLGVTRPTLYALMNKHDLGTSGVARETV